jgi:uncharacterized protein
VAEFIAGGAAPVAALRARWAQSPALVRFVPLLLVLLLTGLQGQFGEASRYWVYVFKCIAGLGALWLVWPIASELRWRFSWPAVLVGLAIYLVWTLGDPFYPKWPTKTEPWDPRRAFGPQMAAFFIAVRIAGSALIMPPLEELFYRSFLYRYFAQKDFLSIPLNRFLPGPFVITAVLFGFAHREWLAGILCGLAYQWLVLRYNRLGDAMTAHAITNLLLGIHVFWRQAYHFW